MRLSRSSRKKSSRSFPFRQVAGIVVISAYGISQVATPTYAVFTSNETQETVITAAFVFPNTVNEIADCANKELNNAIYYREIASNVLKSLRDEKMTSDAAEDKARIIEEGLVKIREIGDTTATLVTELQKYSVHSQLDIQQLEIGIEQQLSPYGIIFDHLKAVPEDEGSSLEQLLNKANLTVAQFENMDRNYTSAKKIDTYVQASYMKALSAYTQVGNTADETSNMYSQATAIIEELKEAEEKAKKEAEEKAKKEAEEKAKKEAEEKAKKEAEEKAKKEAEEKVKKEAEEKAKKEVEEIAKKEVEEKAKKEVEEKAKKEAEEKAKKEAEEIAKKEAEEIAEPKPEDIDIDIKVSPIDITVKVGETQDIL